MTSTRRCSRCGAPLDPLAPEGRCAACLLRLALDPPVLSGTVGIPVAPEAHLGERIGAYRLLETLGEGGMGIVYLAEQEQPLRRRVALKVIKLGMDTREVVSRFESERQAMALMEHPNIASVFDAGATADGRPYFVMEYVPGIPITGYCDGQKLSTRARLQIFAQVCAAVQHAHQKGIIHRDLKPSNVLVMEQDSRPVPKVIDFGIAKAIKQQLTESTLFTEQGLLIGTPEYMSPEQASLGDRDLDTRTDIYSLGVLLYELLAGALPFDIRGLRRAGYDELRRIIREEEPVKPSTRVDTLGAEAADIAGRRHTDTTTLRRQLRGDLDWITLKALDKDPARRYASASELAADIGRHLNDEPVSAGPPTAAYRLRKLTRKHKGAVTAAVAILIVLLSGFVVSTALFMRAETARQQADAERRTAERQRTLAESATLEAVQQRDLAARQRRAAEAARNETAKMVTFAEAARKEADRQRIEAQRRAYSANIALAVTSLQSFNSNEAIDRLMQTEPALRGWEWGHLFQRTDSSLAVLNVYGRFPVAPPYFLSSSFGFSRDGTRVFWNTERTVHVWDAVSYRPLARYLVRESILALAPDASLIVTKSAPSERDFTLRVVEPDTQKVVASLAGHTDHAIHAAFSRDGRRLASAAADGIRVWDVRSGRLVTSVPAPSIRYVAFGADGSLVAASSQNTVQLWKAESGEPVGVLKGHTEEVRVLAFSPDGKRIASGSQDRTVRIWDVQSGASSVVYGGHTAPVLAVAFNPDGTKVITGAADGTVRLWDARGGPELATLFGKRFGVISVASDPTGRWVLSGDMWPTGQGQLRVWDSFARGSASVFEGTEETADPIAFSPSGRTIVFSPDGRSFVTGSEAGMVRVYDVDTRKTRTVFRAHTAPIRNLAFDRSGTRLVSGSDDTTAKIWDLSGKLMLTATGHTAGINAVAFSPSGAEFASASHDKTVRVWDTRSGKDLARLNLDEPANAVLFMEDGNTLIVGAADSPLTTLLITPGSFRYQRGRKTLQLWHWRSGRVTATADGLDGWGVFSIALRPGGSQIAVTGSGALQAKVWTTQLKLTTGIRSLFGHAGPVFRVAFTHDGKRLITAGQDGSVRLWDADTHEPLLVLHDPGGRRLRGLAVSPDGSRFATVSGNSIHVWDASVPYPLEATRLVNRLFVQLAFSRDVVKHLESDRALPAALRDAAIRLAESRGDDPQQLEGRSWSIAKAPNGESTTYRLAVRCAELSAHLAPWESRFITTLGAAYYRVGEYERSLTILTRQGSRPSGENRLETAFIAMAHHRLGHATTARALVDDLRGPLENRSREPFREIQDLPALLREAETTLASPATGTRHAASPRSGAS